MARGTPAILRRQATLRPPEHTERLTKTRRLPLPLLPLPKSVAVVLRGPAVNHANHVAASDCASFGVGQDECGSQDFGYVFV
ncbi:uncharacterized protein PITG_06027 [Phytophthora infestans T30-4]|uniref:Uncharacterized protein n=1 Tax=Phytophthora infestans (strain T30-4) TaxID=403677 RepID=D0N693_PHYIT|nr:uncharacterized protein PITG_06027 [Phytophthora infestans T30-4]EEY70584.1 hypothetical protein PITG_06027 [Phytophthora infestans T30-4]|eukprot:XP_002998238.1 hypothetical protein PITG_06027 [Phytophthora infestans T30-4]